MSIFSSLFLCAAAAICSSVWTSWTQWSSATIECDCIKNSYKFKVLYRGKCIILVFSLISAHCVFQKVVFIPLFMLDLEWGGHWSYIKLILGAGIRVSIPLPCLAENTSVSCYVLTKLVNSHRQWLFVWLSILHLFYLIAFFVQVYDWKAASETGCYQIYSCQPYCNLNSDTDCSFNHSSFNLLLILNILFEFLEGTFSLLRRI